MHLLLKHTLFLPRFKAAADDIVCFLCLPRREFKMCVLVRTCMRVCMSERVSVCVCVE